MKKIRKHMQLFAYVMSSAMLFLSCEQYDNDDLDVYNKSQNLTTSVRYSGEKLFRGVFFMQNEVTQGIPELNAIKSQIKNSSQSNETFASLDSLADISVNYINKNYPNFFSNFKKTLYSNDLYSIEQKMKDAAMIIEQAGLQSTEFAEVFLVAKGIKDAPELNSQIADLDLTNPSDQQEFEVLLTDHFGSSNIYNKCTPFFWCALAVFYAVAAAVSIAVAAYSVVTKVAYWDVFEKASYNIEKELMIAEIANFLK